MKDAVQKTKTKQTKKKKLEVGVGVGGINGEQLSKKKEKKR